MIGGALAPRGGDRPHRARGRPTRRRSSSATSAPPTAHRPRRRRSWTRSRCTSTARARASRRRFEHPRTTTIGIADYPKLVELLGARLRRHGTAGLDAADRLRRVRRRDDDPGRQGAALHRARGDRDRSTRRPRPATTPRRSTWPRGSRTSACSSSSTSSTSPASKASRRDALRRRQPEVERAGRAGGARPGLGSLALRRWKPASTSPTPTSASIRPGAGCRSRSAPRTRTRSPR